MALKKISIYCCYIALLVAVFLSGYQYKVYQYKSQELVAFIPLFADTRYTGIRYTTDKTLLNDENFRNNVVYMLEYYEERYQVIDNQIMIDPDLATDKEMIWNYTIKAKSGRLPQ